jgi:polysaccharide pyruvyl transferase WcaK-like protein
MVVTADAALNVAACSQSRVEEILETTGLPYKNEEIIAININSYLDSWAGDTAGTLTREAFLSVFTSSLNTFVERYKTPILFVSTQHNDIEITSELMRRLNKTVPMAHITNKVYLHDEIKGVLSRMGLLVGMRLHAMILGSSGLCPIAGLAYQPKNNYYFRELGLPERCMSFQHFNEPKLYDHISSAWEDRKKLKEHLIRRIPELQRKALLAATLIQALDNGTPLTPLLRQLASPQSVSVG